MGSGRHVSFLSGELGDYMMLLACMSKRKGVRFFIIDFNIGELCQDIAEAIHVYCLLLVKIIMAVHKQYMDTDVFPQGRNWLWSELQTCE